MTDYDFRNLSPIDFEALVRDLLGAETKRTFETFAAGPDGGIDCRSIDSSGTIIAQCKHRPDGTKSQIKNDAKKELNRMSKEGYLSQDSVSTLEDYYFVTSASLTPKAIDEVAETLSGLVLSLDRIWPRGRLNAIINRHREIERRHFKLWLNSVEVFERVIGSSEWERNRALIRSIQDRVTVYVDTPKYNEALRALDEEQVVIISGAPGVGKSTLAEMLLLAHWEAGWRVIDLVSDISHAWSQFREDSTERTIFYYDDFLGQTSTLEMQKNEGSDLGRLVNAIRRSESESFRLVMTTREQILNAAASGQDDRIKLALSGLEKIRVELSELNRNTRAKMLFNHIYFTYKNSAIKRRLAADRRYLKVIDHESFNPRILESVVILKRPGDVDALYSELLHALDHPDGIWSGSFLQLSEVAIRILLNLAIRPDRSARLSEIEAIFDVGDPRELYNDLSVMEDTWIKIEVDGINRTVRLYDPSRRDFLLDRFEQWLMVKTAMRDATTLRQVLYLIEHLHRVFPWQLKDELIRQADELSCSLLDEEASTRLDLVPLISTACSILRYFPVDARLRNKVEIVTAPLDGDDLSEFRTFPEELFTLAESLAFLPERWACCRVHVCVDAAIDEIMDSQDLMAFADTKRRLFDRGIEISVDQRIEQALEKELEELIGHNDRAMMEQWLEELIEVAEMLGMNISTDAAEEAISHAQNVPVPSRSVQSHENIRAVEPGNSNDDIAALFARLRP